MKANFHTHTFRCRHADGTEREYIEEAIRAGLTTLGFSDHAPYIFTDGHYSSFRMLPEELPDYVSTLSSLREEYADRIRIYIGLEAEYYPEDWVNFTDMIKGKGLDYLIQGQHYPKSEASGAFYSGRPCADEGVLADYVNSIIAGAKTGLFSYVAHPDMINFTGSEEVFRAELDRMIKEVKKEGLPFEINLLGLREGRHYPTTRFYELLAENHAKVVLGSDAHEKQYVCHKETIERAMDIVKTYGLEVTEDIDMTKLYKHGLH